MYSVLMITIVNLILFSYTLSIVQCVFFGNVLYIALNVYVYLWQYCYNYDIYIMAGRTQSFQLSLYVRLSIIQSIQILPFSTDLLVFKTHIHKLHNPCLTHTLISLKFCLLYMQKNPLHPDSIFVVLFL